MTLIDLIRREAIVTEEPVECDLCGAPARCGHVGGRGWACVACCERRPEYAVSTQTAGGVTTAWIGAHQIGTIDLPYWDTRVDYAVRRLLEGLAGAWICARWSCETCHDQGWVYPDGSQHGTRDDDVPCPDCSGKATR